jgi:hypothetical protein
VITLFFRPFVTCSEGKGVLERGWRVGFRYSPAIAQITISSFKLYVSLNEVDFFRAVWNETLLLTLMQFMPAKRACILLKINFRAYYKF